ncbi:MAG: gamma carbonic anhydrase family protein [Methanobacteriaceae archaeon]|nr:gamma carbonic anhydrase family protein [Methanobacteriaceae archaeon]
MIKDLGIGKPSLAKDVFIAESAQIIGRVTAGSNSSFWYNSVTRGDMNDITIGESTNIQDGSMLHVDKYSPLTIGSFVTVGHGAILHGCTILDYALVGMGAIILNGAIIGEGSIIGAGSLVKENMIVPPHSLVIGVPGKVVRTLPESELQKRIAHAEAYVQLWKECYKS